MNSERYNQVIDEAHENYEKDTPEQHVVGSDYDPMKHTMIWKKKICPLSGYPLLERFSKEELVEKCKTDPEFSEKWGLKIEERELSLEERSKIWNETHNPVGNIYTHNQYNENEIPSIVITVTYKDEKIEVYE